ncbi:peptidoglycan DD-metalloendopeptidase family protein [Fusobacterium sp.]|uniref:murein hydrolase activator EnvC family protein n=1 Tax=Fusobacterium sp. TaxID=68766 RepID=UPI002603EB61|nr:peptidoglycan DD-metalloendopeptidase family protein [Fusobacterium sp.]
MKITVMKKTAIFFLGLSFITYGSSVDAMKEQIKKLDSEIKAKNQRIENIDIEKKTITQQIEDIKKDIEAIERDKDKIELEIEVVSKNIDYGEKNMTLSSNELQRKKAEFDAKIIAWSRKTQGHQDFEEDSILKKQFARVLYEDLNRMTKIKDIQTDIATVKANIEKEKRKLSSLKSQLNAKKVQIAKKQEEQNELIKKLNLEKTTHIKTISHLEKEKQRIEKEIEDIIKKRTVISKDVDFNKAQANLGKALKPVQGNITVRFKQQKAKSVMSNGIEISSNLGNRVRASMKGKVIYVDKLQGLGKVIMIDYGYNTIGVYGNVISARVKVNQRVEANEPIGILGLSTEGKPNLYYEVRFNLKPINPELMF